MDALQHFLESERNTFDAFAQQVSAAELHAAAELIWSAQAEGNRVHVTGIGKPGHVATYLASLMSSTGTPTYFLHGTEAVHGSCGQLVPGDVVICIFNSGETAEMKATVQAIRRNGCKIIGVTGNRSSWLASFADTHLFAGYNAYQNIWKTRHAFPRQAAHAVQGGPFTSPGPYTLPLCTSGNGHGASGQAMGGKRRPHTAGHQKQVNAPSITKSLPVVKGLASPAR